ncbi:MAG TPA: MXAN_6640 family putative metalloprotease [Clostridia bacterium]|nr:MXAN_6640 family putative metalloprotease [Clostridia bacterium]
MLFRKRLKIIKGNVIDVEKNECPLAGVKINLYTVRDIKLYQDEEEAVKLVDRIHILTTKTDENGEFLFILRDGTYSVNVDVSSLPDGKCIKNAGKIIRSRDFGFVSFEIKDFKLPNRESTQSQNAAKQLSTIEKIMLSRSMGEIDDKEKIQYLLNVLFNTRNPDNAYQSKVPDKSGTTAVEEIYRYIESENADSGIVNSAKSLLGSHIPSLDKNYISPSGYFNIHYTLTGSNAVIFQSGSRKSVPSYVKEIGLAFDKAKNITCDIRGFREPVREAGKNTYDVYVIDLKDKYGITLPRNFYLQKSGSRTASSYICIDNSYSKSKGFLKSREDCMSVTAAHEFFHSVQYAYNYDADSWWKEASATWNEDEVYKGINDYIRYLNSYFSAPYRPLDKSSYSGVVFVKYLSEYCGGYNIIKKIWESQSEDICNSIEAIDRALKENTEGQNLSQVFSRFTAFNINPAQYYKEGKLWNAEVLLNNSHKEYPVSVNSAKLEHLSSNYIAFETADHGNKPLKIVVSNESKGKCGFKLQKRKKADQSYQMSDINIDRTYSEAEITVKNFGKVYDRICLITSSLELTKDISAYSYSAVLDD